MNRGEWARAFLSALGNGNPDARTINWVASWTLGENTAAKYNPLATTQPMGADCEAGNFNFANVKNYKSHECGIQASIKTVTNGRYPHIVNGLRNNDPEEASNAVELGTWGTGMGFVSLWRLNDNRSQALLSHQGRDADIVPVPNRVEVEVPQGNPGGINLDMPGLPDTSSIGRSLAFVGLGGLLLFISLILAIRTYVPTEQIVKTVAMAAA